MNREPDEMEYVLVGLLIWFTLAGLGGLIALFMYNEHPWVLIARFPLRQVVVSATGGD